MPDPNEGGSILDSRFYRYFDSAHLLQTLPKHVVELRIELQLYLVVSEEAVLLEDLAVLVDVDFDLGVVQGLSGGTYLLSKAAHVRVDVDLGFYAFGNSLKLSLESTTETVCVGDYAYADAPHFSRSGSCHRFSFRWRASGVVDSQRGQTATRSSSTDRALRHNGTCPSGVSSSRSVSCMSSLLWA